jgi:hypothetical protein
MTEEDLPISISSCYELCEMFKTTRGIHASTCKDFWLKSKAFLPVAAGKNLINCYSIYILKMGRIYIKTCKKINNFKMIS